jgi:hypothetical protein
MRAALRLALVALVALPLLASDAAAQSRPAYWYDADHQALAIDPYADGWGGKIEIDFNADHAWAGIVDQGLWHYLYGNVTLLGLYHTETTVSPEGWVSSGTWYGWGDLLGSLAPVADFCTDVTRLASFPDTPTPESFHYFTDLWDVVAGATVVYVRPLGECGAGVPLTDDVAATAYVKVGFGEWQPITVPPAPRPPPLIAGAEITPQVLDLGSSGAITVRLTLPDGLTAADVDLTSVRLTVEEDVRDDAGALQGRAVHVFDRAAAGRIGRDLSVKFDRRGLLVLLAPGNAVLTVSGALLDGRRFEAVDTLQVVADGT